MKYWIDQKIDLFYKKKMNLKLEFFSIINIKYIRHCFIINKMI